MFKDPYVLDFLGLEECCLEKDSERAILRELEAFILELGTGFCFVARQMRLQIDDEDFFIDPVFFNRKLRLLVAVELKVGVFRAEYNRTPGARRGRHPRGRIPDRAAPSPRTRPEAQGGPWSDPTTILG